jgi:outer membrane protein OmpA-like peptidoglycan-associated protein
MKFQRKLSAAMATVLMGSGLAALSTPASAAVDNSPRDCNLNEFAAGNGSEFNPIQIWDAQDLLDIEISGCENENAYFVLMADLDLSNFEDWDPIGGNGGYNYSEYDADPFNGQFDGNDHSVIGLDISISAFENQAAYGLFGGIYDAEIMNLTVSGTVDVESYYEDDDIYETCFEGYEIGGVAGYMVDSHMNNVTSNVDVSGGEGVGGVVGAIYTDGGHNTLDNVNSTGRVTGDGYCGADEVGGIAGRAYDSTIRNSTSSSYVTTDDDNNTYDIGGLIGYAQQMEVINSTFTGEVYVVDASSVGGLIGYADDAEIEASSNSGKIQVAGDYADDLGGLVGHYDGSCEDGTAGISNSFNAGEVFGPMVRSVGGLVGEWEDNDCDSNEDIASYTIDSYNTGTITGEEEVGGLFGYGTPRSITDSWVDATVNHIGWDQWAAGGIAGYANDYSIFNGIKFEGTLNSGADYATGGLIGYAAGFNLIYGSSVDATINAGHVECEDCWDIDDIGGLVGYADNDVQIVRSSAHGEIKMTSDEETYSVGGLVGELGGSSSIASSYSKMKVTGYREVGGLVGYYDGGSMIRNTYVIADVTGEDEVAGLIGVMDDSDDPVTANYYVGVVTAHDGDMDPFINDDGSDWYDYTETNFFWDESGEVVSYAGANGVTAAELKDPQTFFESGLSIRQNGVWAAGKAWATCGEINDGLPYLSWQVTSDPCPCVAVTLPNIQFKADSANLSYESRQALKKAAKAIAAARCTTVDLVGFTSTLKATKFAKKLATARVNNVKNFMLDQLWDLDHAVKFTTSIRNVNSKNPADRKVTSVALKMKR